MVRLRYLKVLLGGWILILLVVSGLAAPFLAPFDPQEQRLESRLQPPTWMGGQSSSSWLGTDNLGRDILSRIIYGSRISLLVAVEKEFNVRFRVGEVEAAKNVGEFADLIVRRMTEK